MDLINQVGTLNKQLTASIGQLKNNGIALAEAERDYKVKLHTEALKMRENGVAVGMIDLTIHGAKEVAELRFKRDVAKTIYDTNLERINATKLQIRILDSQISREWGAPNETK